uniref:Alternative protein SNTB2 n=1 Tax=Homo sapiens TaxID=9606 RepID=L8EAJ4_HUMAN|nr:alternative protein SNTB2 [Homo sapiens]
MIFHCIVGLGILVRFIISGRVRWLMPVFPVLWEPKVGGSPEVRSLRPAWPTW